MKTKIVGILESFAKAMVQPLMYLSAAGIIMVFGVLLTNNNIREVLPFLNWPPIQILGNLIYNAVMVIINNLSVVFAVGIAAAFAKGEKHKAAIIGLMSYLMYLISSNTLLVMSEQLAPMNPQLGLIGSGQASILGIQVVDMSVFGGIIIGCLTGYVFNRTYQKRFKGAFQIYSGANFSFIVMFFSAIAFAVLSNTVWPYVQDGIAAMALLIKESGNVGLFFYGFLERLLIPTGLHHLVYTPFQFTDLGGVLQVGDQTVVGAYPIVMAQMQMPGPFSDSIYYMATGFTKMFGYIGIGAAFIHTAHKENKAKTRAIVIPLIITACLASVTEPLDFMFVFIAPLLYVLHAVIAGTFIVLLKVFEVTAFTGGNLLTSILMNVATGVEKTNYPMLFVLGIVQIFVYYFLFSFIIRKFNLKTPGRETKEETTDKTETKAVTTDTESLDVASIVEGLGGKENIETVGNCITRLRVSVKDVTKVNDELINKVKNSGIVKKGNNIQVIYGLQVEEIRRAVDAYLEK